MGIADIFILGFILFFAVRGLLRGFIVEVIGFLGIILAFLFSFMIYTPMLSLVSLLGIKGNTGSVVAYILGFIIIYVVVILLGRILNKLFSAISLGWLNRLIGLIFGGIKGAVIIGIILWVIVFAIPNAKFSNDIKQSSVASSTMKLVPYVYDKINAIAGIDRINPFSK